jgi:hypothetical protein
MLMVPYGQEIDQCMYRLRASLQKALLLNPRSPTNSDSSIASTRARGGTAAPAVRSALSAKDAHA